MAKSIDRSFHVRFPFRLRAAMTWVASVHRWLLQQNLNIGMDRLLIPTEVQEKERGVFRVFFSGGVNVWVHQRACPGPFGEQWDVTRIRVTYPDGQSKAEKVWEGEEVCQLATS